MSILSNMLYSLGDEDNTQFVIHTLLWFIFLQCERFGAVSVYPGS